MQITSKKVGEGYFAHQLQINAVIGIPAEIKVICRSASRNDTSYEIFDQAGNSMGLRKFSYATHRMNRPLVDDLNVLLEEFGRQVDYEDFYAASLQAINCCEGRFGNGIEDGDAIISIH